MKSVLAFCLALTVALPARPATQSRSYPPVDKVRQDFAGLLERPKAPLAPAFTPAVENSAAVEGQPDVRFAVERGSFASEPNKRVPALVVKRQGAAGRLPAVIVMHGTGGTKEAMRSWVDPFAARGYVAMAIDARHHGEWVPGGAHGSREYNEAAIAAWQARPGEPREYPFWYDSVWDVWRAVDYLISRADVDPHRIAVLGVSMGGIQAYYAAAVDMRIAAVVPLIATQSMRWSLENGQWQGRANTIRDAHRRAAADLGEPQVNARVVRELWTKLLPGVLDDFDNPSIIRLIAPRPLLVLSTENDQNCPLPGAQLAFAQAQLAYTEARASDKLKIDVAPGARHEVVPAHRQLANAWLDRQFGVGSAQGGAALPH